MVKNQKLEDVDFCPHFSIKVQKTAKDCLGMSRIKKRFQFTFDILVTFLVHPNNLQSMIHLLDEVKSQYAIASYRVSHITNNDSQKNSIFCCHVVRHWEFDRFFANAFLSRNLVGIVKCYPS